MLIVRGTLIHAASADTAFPSGDGGSGPLEVVRDAVVVVSAHGVIDAIVTDGDEVERLWEQHKHDDQASTQCIRVQEPDFIAPGFIDVHFHAPQFAFTGTATDKPLMGPEGWLECYTFPAERRCEDVAYAKKLYTSCVATLVSHATTTCVFFGTVHAAATAMLGKICLEAGQRAVVGKVAMDRNAPDNYRDESAAAAVAGTEALISEIYGAQQTETRAPLVDVAITPRFLPTCSIELLEAFAALWDRSAAAGVPLALQTHIAESIDEVAFCKALHPDRPRDLQVFDDARLLRPRSILAHAVFLTDAELDRVAASGAAIAFCPLSNFFFAGKHLDVATLLRHKPALRLGLATDVAGGYAVSMLTACRATVLSSKALDHVDNAQNFQSDGEPKAAATAAAAGGTVRDFDFRHAFWMATAGGARALHRSDVCGRFAVGLEFDAQIVSPPRDPVASAAAMTPATMLQALERYINLGDDRNVAAVFVRGRKVK